MTALGKTEMMTENYETRVYKKRFVVTGCAVVGVVTAIDKRGQTSVFRRLPSPRSERVRDIRAQHALQWENILPSVVFSVRHVETNR